jgi:hypothetical protein
MNTVDRLEIGVRRATAVHQYLRDTRQWTRQCRIGSAQLSLEQAKPEDKWFWLQVLIALGAPNAKELPH